jgi:hypothetical protein
MTKSNRLFILVGLVFCILLHGRGHEPIVSYYKPGDLFNQKAILKKYALVLKSEGFDVKSTAMDSATLHASSADLDKALENHFYKQRSSLYQQAFLRELGASSIIPLSLLTGIMLVHKYNLFDSKGIFDSMASLNAFFSLAYGSEDARKLLMEIIKPSKDPLLSYELAYAKKKRFLNFLDEKGDAVAYKEHKNISYAESQFLAARRNPADFQHVMRFFNTFLAIPVKSIPLYFDTHKAAAGLSLYSDEAQRIIIGACLNHMNAYQKTIGPNKRSREFLNFFSRPGTGKTTCARSIAEMMGLPIVTVCLAGGDAEKIFGSETSPGLILEALTQLGCRNGILLFDELDRVIDDNKLMSVLLPFFDPNEKIFYSRYLRRHIDVSHLFFIVAGNLSFKEEALKSRFHHLKTISLDITNHEQLMHIVMDNYLPTKLSEQESALLDDATKKMWERDVRQYLSAQEYLSLRDAQAKIDQLLGAWRLKVIENRTGSSN